MSEPKEMPARIWLQEEGGEVTWCSDKINDDDTEYVRADLVADEVRPLEAQDAAFETAGAV